MTPAASQYLVGNRVYRGGSNAPNVGQVDPSGYITRELQSNRRSGLAATALRLMEGSGAQQQNQQQPQPQHFSGVPVGNQLLRDAIGRLALGQNSG